MADLVENIQALRQAALIRVAEEYNMRYSTADISEALENNRNLKQGLRRLLGKQPADTRVAYMVRRFSSVIYRRITSR